MGNSTARQTKIIRCMRCARRCRNDSGWNVQFIAGLECGVVCPTCQTLDEDLEAELNLITNHPSGWGVVAPHDGTDTDRTRFLTEVVERMVNAYPTPEVIRDKAGQLAAARKDDRATAMVKLMREVADDMESGALWS